MPNFAEAAQIFADRNHSAYMTEDGAYVLKCGQPADDSVITVIIKPLVDKVGIEYTKARNSETVASHFEEIFAPGNARKIAEAKAVAQMLAIHRGRP